MEAWVPALSRPLLQSQPEHFSVCKKYEAALHFQPRWTSGALNFPLSASSPRLRLLVSGMSGSSITCGLSEQFRKVAGKCLAREAFMSTVGLSNRISRGPDALAAAMEEGKGMAERRRTRAAIFWDLDNKPPVNVPPMEAAVRLKDVALNFGEIVDFLAYANQHAFTYVPENVRQERREQKQRFLMEARGEVVPEEPYTCGMCGRKLRTGLQLQKHFKELHQREHQKRMARLSQLNPSRKRKVKQQMADKNERYCNAARGILVPKRGYYLAPELKRAGVIVRVVSNEPQAADIALKRDLHRAIGSNQVDAVCLISDDGGFASSILQAKRCGLSAVVIGSTPNPWLKKYADLWYSWEDVSTGRAVANIRMEMKSLHDRKELEKELEIFRHKDDAQSSYFRGTDSLQNYNYSHEDEQYFDDIDEDGDYDDDDDDDETYAGDFSSSGMRGGTNFTSPLRATSVFSEEE
eukprot:TRINITY_DN2306_c0_g1_i1.p1 TRINITY_DN2306_c0_g1~~TRINITY_DN2306_c0_g1_i1.p1  ORF type:complete len:465 (-),score=105.78 TRINITY_DN2306_c0_g1_i1:118-1512(-)